MEVSGQLHVSAALPPGKEHPGGPQSRSGRDGEEINFQPLPGIEPRCQPIIEIGFSQR